MLRPRGWAWPVLLSLLQLWAVARGQGWCPQSTLERVLPGSPQDVVTSTLVNNQTCTAPSWRIKLTGSTTAIHLPTGTVYRLEGSLVFPSQQGSSNICQDVLTAEGVAQKVFASTDNMVLGARGQWVDVTCCGDPALPDCQSTVTISKGPVLNSSAVAGQPLPLNSSLDWLILSSYQYPDSITALTASTSAASVDECQQACVRNIKCTAFSFSVPNCTLYDIAPSSISALVRCNAASSTSCGVFGTRLTGSCGRTATAGIRAVGRATSDLNKTALPGQDQDLIPQGGVVASVSDCSCRCDFLPNCGAYTFIGSTGECWLHEQLNTAAIDATVSSLPLDITGVRVITASDAVLLVPVNKGAPVGVIPPYLPPTAWTAQNALTTNLPLYPVTPADSMIADMVTCQTACRNSTGCGALGFDPVGPSCVLLSTDQLTFSGVSQTLKPKDVCASENCTLLTRAQGSCGLIASAGIVGVGQVWADWVLSKPEGPVVDSVSECACLCASTADCLAYVYLGEPTRTCLTRKGPIAFDRGLVASVKYPAAIAGRLELPGNLVAQCSSDQAMQPAVGTFTPRTLANHGPLTPQQCNQQCLQEAPCLGFSMDAPPPAPGAPPVVSTCRTYSSLSTVDAQSLPAQSTMYTLLPCQLVAANAGIPPTTESAQQGSSDNKKRMAAGLGVGLAVGAVVMAVAIIVAFLLYRKHKRQRQGGADGTQPGALLMDHQHFSSQSQSRAITLDPARSLIDPATLPPSTHSTPYAARMVEGSPIKPSEPHKGSWQMLQTAPGELQLMPMYIDHSQEGVTSFSGHPNHQASTIFSSPTKYQTPPTEAPYMLSPAGASTAPQFGALAPGPLQSGLLAASITSPHIGTSGLGMPLPSNNSSSLQMEHMRPGPLASGLSAAGITMAYSSTLQGLPTSSAPSASAPSDPQYPTIPPVAITTDTSSFTGTAGAGTPVMGGQAMSHLPPGRRLNPALSRSQQINPAVRAVSMMLDAPSGSPGGQSMRHDTACTFVTQTQGMASVTGLVAGDPFLVAVAPHYKWSTAPLTGFVAIEEGINAARMAAQGAGGKWSLPKGEPGPPPVQLSCKEVQEHIQLMVHGLIGKGSTSMVFKCCWPSKFGAKSLLAAKVLRNPYCEHLQQMIASFQYEADVLSRCRHPNVVRLYGYCLEPPCVCLIMELLPTTLKSRLYANSDSKQRRDHLETLPSSVTPSTLTKPVASSEEETQCLTAGMVQSAALEAEAVQSRPIPGRTPRKKPAGNSTSSNLVPWSSGESNVSSVLGTQNQEVPAQLYSILEQGPIKVAPATPLTDIEILKFGADIAAGLAHLHAKPEARGEDPSKAAKEDVADLEEEDEQPVLKRVVHRDLKPANILINSKGVAKISDFGLAREHHSTTIVLEQRAAGTLHYMAPELMSENSMTKITDRVDIYSLGMILWEMAAGEVPWNGRKDQQILALAPAGTRPPLMSVKKEEQGGTSMFQRQPKYAALVSSCWNEKPERRPKASLVRTQLQKEVDKLQAAATSGQPA